MTPTRLIRLIVTAIAAASVCVVAIPGSTVTADAASSSKVTQAQLKKRALQLQFDYSLGRFGTVKRGHKGELDAKFTWIDNGCSAPAIVAGWSSVFDKSCNRHDFGYRNFGHGLALQSNDAMKRRIDSQLYADMNTQCSQYSGSKSDCRRAASVFYTVVKKAGAAQTAFYNRECPQNRFCLFDDHGYGDRRIALKSAISDLNDIDFGDKASSVKNRSNVWWLIYDDHGYQDRALCIKPGVVVNDLNNKDFGDKASSAKPLTTSRCPRGSTVIN